MLRDSGHYCEKVTSRQLSSIFATSRNVVVGQVILSKNSGSEELFETRLRPLCCVPWVIGRISIGENAQCKHGRSEVALTGRYVLSER